MRSKGLERLLRFLLVLLGVGLGLTITQLGLQLYQLANKDANIPAWLPVAGYVGMGLIGGVILLLLSKRILRRFTILSSAMQKQLDKMPLNQLMSAITGLILGLVVAALLSRMLSFLGNAMSATALSAILYASLGALGYNIGKRRAREFNTMITRLSGVHEKRKITRHGYAARKFLDTSALVDGRILEVLKTGFIEGEVILPQYVIDEMQRLADSSDETTREKGRRGLEVLKSLQEQQLLTVDPTDDETTRDVDVKLLRAARDCGGTVITTDTNLQKAAAVSMIRTLNVHELAEALRPAATEGMTLQVRIGKEGREPGQGVGYLADGTMVVVEDGKSHLGDEVTIVVSSVRQTSAGRMIFAKLA
ncbi:MAG: TRAM domain-containing protein [Clostridiales bacterium]|nr:TRAM domain-containing protein [Clostridiales bacterium]